MSARHAVLATAVVAAMSVTLVPTSAHAALPNGFCEDRNGGYLAGGSWTAHTVTLSGRTRTTRFGRDTSTTVEVVGVGTYRRVGAARVYTVDRRITKAPTAHVTQRLHYGGTQRCSFVLAHR